MSRARLLVVAAAVVVLLAAVGAIGALTRDSKDSFALPRCSRPAHAIQPGSPYPRALPLPQGTVFSTLARYPNVIIVGGRVPLELVPATRFFVNELPRKGFSLGSAESEPGLEAEADFMGHGVAGRFRVRRLPRCSGAVLLVLSIARAGHLVTTPTAPVRGGLPACAGAGADVAGGLPASFPLPPGTIIRSSRKHTIRGRSFRFVAAVTAGSIDSAARFLLHKLPRAGYRITGAEREATEAEAVFAGHGVHGRVRFHTLFACAGVLTVDIAATRD